MRRKDGYDLYQLIKEKNVQAIPYANRKHANEPKCINAIIALIADYGIVLPILGLPVGMGLLIAKVVFSEY